MTYWEHRIWSKLLSVPVSCIILIIVVVIVQLLSCVQIFATPWTAAYSLCMLSFTISQSLLKLMSIESVKPSNHLILCHPLLFLPSVFPSIRVFSSELTLHIRYPKYWSFSFSLSFSFLPMNIQSWFPLGLTVWSPCHARDCQESSPEQFKSINSSVFSFLHSLTLTSIHDH